MPRISTLLLFTIGILFGTLNAQHSQALTGYIVTKNNYHLTGAIGLIEHTKYGSMVEFINDFGTPYFLHPALIKGFVFFEGPAISAYESKYYRNTWMFLRLQYSGDNISLLQTPETLIKYEWFNGNLVAHDKKIVQYWVELPGDRILPLKKLGFRRQMRRLMSDTAPRLSRLIGKKGYRFKDLYTILEAYDKECAKGKRRL
ncbi:MAG: hypothetical protein ACRBG0_12805 [Lewinella sp.]|uniref:hypothetical protein n=1 Tax=Lewinella sp. TaxID=2004506 RepID=UPI003D6C401A